MAASVIGVNAEREDGHPLQNIPRTILCSRASRGQLLAYVGGTGDASASAPHLHFAIARLDTDRAWWKGDPINPYPLLAK
jgi:hypothetical protein